MLMRHVVPADVPVLQSLMRNAPQKSGGVEFSLLNEPDFFGRAKAYERSRVLVAEQDGELAGSAAVAVRDQCVNGERSSVAYEFQYFTAPAHRRKGVANRLRDAVDSTLIQQGVDFSTAMIADQNEASMRLFEQHGFVLHRRLELTLLLIQGDETNTVDPSVRRATPADAQAIANLLNETWREHEMRTPASARSVTEAMSRVPTLGFDRTFVQETDGQVTATASIWDWSAVQPMFIHEVADDVRKVLPGLRPNEPARNWALSMIGYRNPQALNHLLHAIAAEAARVGIDHVGIVSEPDAPVVSTDPGIKTAKLGVNLFVKTYNGKRLNSRAPVFVDAVDL